MKMCKKVICLIMSVLVLISVFGCTVVKDENKEVRTVDDLGGNTVELPSGEIYATANSGWITSQVVMLAGADKIKIAPASFESGHTDRFAELFTGTDDIPLTDGDKVSAEEMLAAGVNVFFASNQSEADTYKNAGLTCIVMNYDTTENLARSFVLIGEVFGGEALIRGRKISASILNSEKTAKENAEKNTSVPTVYCIAATTQTTPYLTQGEETFANKLFDMCGAKQITSGKGMYVNVNAEFLMEQDPDYIVIDGYLAEEAYTELVNDPVLKNLTAVKENNIIYSPIGILRPCLRPGAETSIGILWLSETFSQDDSVNIDLVQYSIDLYKDVFGWDISEKEVKDMLFIKD